MDRQTAFGRVSLATKIEAFSLGAVTRAFFAGLLIGWFPPRARLEHENILAVPAIFFGIGYSVGPQFLQALHRDGLKPILVTVVAGITGFATALLAKTLRLDPGYVAGFLSGSLTRSVNGQSILV